MAFYCQNMLEMALIPTEYDPIYEEFAFKFLQHFMWISYAMDRIAEHHDDIRKTGSRVWRASAMKGAAAG